MTTKILVVDDEPAIGKLLLYQLRQYGYHVAYEPDGLLALKRVGNDRPDLILLDVMLPTISGWEICRQIRTSSTVPIIMLTAKNADLDIVTGLSAGADDYIAKPFSLVQLQARIEAVLRRSGESPVRRRADVPPDARTEPGARRQTPTHSGEAAARRPHANGVEPATRTHVNGSTPDARPPQAASTAATAPPAQQAAEPAAAPAEQAEPLIGPAVALIAEPPQRLGQRLRDERLARGLSLSQAEQECHVRWEFLQAIEQENFSYVPRAQLRTALNTYATYLGLDLRALIQRPPPHARRQHGLHYAAVALLLLLLVSLYVLSMS